MRLIVVRHAEAGPGKPDELRPLTAAGRAAARALADALPRPDAVVCSPFLRARETAALLAAPAGLEPEPDDRLAPGATADDVRAAVAGRGETVVAVGHQPDCGLIVAELTGQPPPPFPPGAAHDVEL